MELKPTIVPTVPSAIVTVFARTATWFPTWNPRRPNITASRLGTESFLVWAGIRGPHHGSVMRANGTLLAPHVILRAVVLSRECLSPR